MRVNAAQLSAVVPSSTVNRHGMMMGPGGKAVEVQRKTGEKAEKMRNGKQETGEKSDGEKEWQLGTLVEKPWLVVG
jgi:hypothetical protein